MDNLNQELAIAKIKQLITWKIIGLGCLSMIIAGISVLVFGGIYVLLTWLINHSWSFPNWSLEGFTSLITLALIIGGLVFAAIQHRHAEIQHMHAEIQQAQEKNTIAYNIYEALYSRITNLEEEAARRWIIKNITPLEPGESEEEWVEAFREAIKQGKEKPEATEQPEEQQYIKRALNSLDYMGFIAQNYLNVEEALMKWMSPPVSKVWKRLKVYVKHERIRRNEPDWYDSAEYIGEACIEWRELNGLDEPKIVDDTV
jgi:hypothetical protein